jgi:UDP:flavonoid glycosyltransferase YjiC (YdhE family)/glycosyltransferase involved in cell wall biosynthesis
LTRLGSYDYDVALLSDFRYPGGTSVSVAEEVAAQAAAGYTTALVPATSPGLKAKRRFHSRIISCVQSGMAEIVAPDQALRVKALVIRHPAIFIEDPDPRPRIDADEVVMVVNQAPAEDSHPGDARYYDVGLAEIRDRLHALFGGEILWAPIGPVVRHALLRAEVPLKLAKSDWHNVLDADAWRADRSRYASDRPVIGRHARPHWKKWPPSAEEILAAYPDDGGFEVKVLGGGEVATRILGRLPENWTLYRFGSIPPDRFLRQIDFGVYYYHPDFTEAFGRTIAESLASGCPTLVPHQLRALFEDACVYAEPAEVQEAVRGLYAQPELYREQSERGRTFIEESFGHEVHRRRIEALIGEPDSPRPIRARPARRRSVLFFTANGVGMGHLTRMMAVARRLPETVEPLFVTLSAGMKVVREAGYFCEYIPQHRGAEWHGFLERRLVEIIRRFDPQGLVFDGTFPWRGLMWAREATGLPFVWARRAMWQPGSGSVNLANGRDFDFVVEPGEFAEAYDEGETTRHRDAVLRVRPILLLDDEDLLERGEARAALGLSPDARAVLIQLGAGNTFDVRSPARVTAEQLLEIGGTEVVFAASPIAREQAELPPGVKRISTYPVSRFLRAFDFAVSAAGYNSFHELIGFGVPTIFVPMDTQLDDQHGRARFAEDVGAGLDLAGFSEHGMARCLELIVDDEKRAEIAARCRELFPGNGARDFADAVSRLLVESSGLPPPR